jgi:hypothetical protein
MHELQMKLEKAKEELRKSYMTEDQDYILACQLDLELIRRQIERCKEV